MFYNLTMQKNISQNPQLLGASVSPSARAKQKNQEPAVIWLTGVSGAGKSTLAFAVDNYLNAEGFHSFVLDGDELRTGISSDLASPRRDLDSFKVGRWFSHKG